MADLYFICLLSFSLRSSLYFHGQAGASYWKRYLSENMCVRDADVKKIDHIMDKIKYNNFDTGVGQSA